LPAERPDGAPVTSLVPGRDTYLLTGDANIIHTSWRVYFHVSNPNTYYTMLATPEDPSAPDPVEKDVNGFVGTRGPQTLVRNLFRSAVIDVTSGLNVDDMLYGKRTEYSDAVQAKFAKLLAEENCGFEVDNVMLEQVFPPLKTKSAFDEVAAASNKVDSMRSMAEQYAVQSGNEAASGKTMLIADAKTYREFVVSEVKSESIYFKSIETEYRKNPKTVLMTLYTNTLSNVLQGLDGKYILGTTGSKFKQVRIQLNPESKRRSAPAAKEK